MLKKICIGFGLLVLAGTTPGSALAITIDGQEFEQFASFNTPGNERLGYWVHRAKFYTFYNSYVPSAIDIDPQSVGEDFSEYDFDSLSLMGTTQSYSFVSGLRTGQLQIADSAGNLLIDATLAESGAGEINTIYAFGPAGQVDIAGRFTLVGGALFDTGLLTGDIYLEMFFDDVFASEGDAYGRDGIINLYRPGGGGLTQPPSSEVPEPSTMLLFASSLLIARRYRERA